MGLDFVELIISIEETFDIAIEDEQASEVVSVDDCYRLILSCLGKSEERLLKDDEVWELMKDLIVFQLGVKSQEVIPTAEFIKDLKVD